MANGIDTKALSELELSVILVAGDHSQSWNINDLHKVVVQKGITIFGDDPRNLAIFLRRRPHLFDYEVEKVFARFDGEEIEMLKAYQNENIVKSLSDLEEGIKTSRDDSQFLANFMRRRSHLDFQVDNPCTKFDSENEKEIQRLNEVISDLKEEILKVENENTKVSIVNDVYAEVQQHNEIVLKSLRGENLKLRREILCLKNVQRNKNGSIKRLERHNSELDQENLVLKEIVKLALALLLLFVVLPALEQPFKSVLRLIIKAILILFQIPIPPHF